MYTDLAIVGIQKWKVLSSKYLNINVCVGAWVYTHTYTHNFGDTIAPIKQNINQKIRMFISYYCLGLKSKRGAGSTAEPHI